MVPSKSGPARFLDIGGIPSLVALLGTYSRILIPSVILNCFVTRRSVVQVEYASGAVSVFSMIGRLSRLQGDFIMLRG